MARETIKEVISPTPLMLNLNLSQEFNANVYLKREDLQVVRSYKIRGAYNKIKQLPLSRLKDGVVCASAGNHAQGVAFSCNHLKIKGTVFMPVPTPRQKVEQVRMFGNGYVEIVLIGDTYDDCYSEAVKYANKHQREFIHPFDDKKVIEGQGTIGLEVLEQHDGQIDFLFMPVGGGGLASGIGSVFSTLSPATKLVGVEPAGAPSMSTSLRNKKNTELFNIDRFVDGAAVRRVGDYTFDLCQQLLDNMVTVDEGRICTRIIELYNKDAIVIEPAGALSIVGLEQFRDQIKGKSIVCIVSGSNNDLTRMEEIKERSLLDRGLKHYFIVRFPQRAGALKEFVADVLGPKDDISHFEYSKKTNRNTGPAVVGIELNNPNDLSPLIARMKRLGFYGEYINEKPDLFQYLT